MARHGFRHGHRLLPPAWGWVACCAAVLWSCARMGSPDGGWYDDTPPRVLSSSPADGAVDVRARKVTINFDEFIKIEDPQNKVVISPPQVEQPDIKASGKRIIVELHDSLRHNTTYTIDFSDAITDNTEGNPMGNYTYSFSTGGHIDTLQVSGYCLNAEDLEPLKGMLVGLYPYAPDTTGNDFRGDTIFRTQPFMRVSRTNGSGRFDIKGVAPGSYRVYALSDADGDLLFSQKSETIGFCNDSIVPSWKPDTRQDTIWLDSLHIADIVSVPYTHFLPDDVTLLCFQEPQTDRYLLKTERQSPEKIGLYFSYGSDSLPTLRGLNFDSDGAFVPEPSQRGDTVFYWLRDTALVNRDTLSLSLTYLMTDSAGALVSQTDTIEALPKVAYEKRLKELQKEREKWEKEQEKKRKRDQPYDSIMPSKPLLPKLSTGGQMDPNQRLTIEMPQPLALCDTSAVHLYTTVDSVQHAVAHVFRQLATRVYELVADWQAGTEYGLEIDSAAFVSIYGLASGPLRQGIKVRSEDDFGTLAVTVTGDAISPADSVWVQLLDSSGKVVRQALTGDDGTADFFYLKPSTYYMRAYVDRNGNGQWDTGLYDAGLQAEPVFYHPEAVECKAKWDVTRSWNLTQVPRHKQKPLSITKQKPDKEKKLRNRNMERARQLGREYVRRMP